MAWKDKVSDVVYKLLCASFNISPSSADGMKRFVPAYVFSATTPQANRDVNVCYYDIRPGNEEGFRYTETKYANKTDQGTNATIQKNIPIRVMFTFYGPNADDDSEYFWGLCQSDINAQSPRAILREKQIVISGKPEFPIGLDEYEGTFVRRRCDVVLNLVLYDTSSIPYTTVEHVPELTVVMNGDNSGDNSGGDTGNTEDPGTGGTSENPDPSTGGTSENPDPSTGGTSENPDPSTGGGSGSDYPWIVPQY